MADKISMNLMTPQLPDVRAGPAFPFPALLVLVANVALSSRANADVNTALAHSIRATTTDSWLCSARGGSLMCFTR